MRHIQGGKVHSKPKRAFGHNFPLNVCYPEDEVSHMYRHSMSPRAHLHDYRCASSSNASWSTSRSRSKVLDDESLVSIRLGPTRQIRSRVKATRSSASGSSGKRKFMLRCFQVLSILIVGISLYALVENIKYLVQTYHDADETVVADEIHVNINEELKSWVIQESLSAKRTTTIPLAHSARRTNKNQFTPSKPVIKISNIRYTINNATMCNTSNTSNGVYFMTIVHSAPENFEARQAIRSTWGSVKILKNFDLRLVFVIGKIGDWYEDRLSLADFVRKESQIFGDIVQGDFVDSYRNLTYKHLLGYRWVSEYCPKAEFILKADDDAFIDIFQLFDFITRTYGFEPTQGTLVCNVYPSGTKPIRPSSQELKKWAVTQEEYPHKIYPKYCGGLAYLITPDAIKRILNASDKVKFFWIDDVFVTGVLRELVGIEPFYLNLRYMYNAEGYRKWLNHSSSYATNSNPNVPSTEALNLLNTSSKPFKFPFMITLVERGADFSEEMNRLWRKTLRVWS